jgi:peroxiredoxin
MKVISSLTRYAFILCAAFMLISCPDDNRPGPAQNTDARIAPDFTLGSLTGQDFRLSNHRGKPVLLIFLTTWCPSCKSEIPHYRKIYETYGKQGLEVVMIDSQESAGTVAHFASRMQIPLKVLLDPQGDVSSIYAVTGVPTMVLIGKDGKVVSREYDLIDSLLENLFTKKQDQKTGK